MLCPYLFLITSATDFDFGKRGQIKNKKTKATTLINIIKSLKPLFLPPISRVVKSVPQQMLRCKLQVNFKSQNKLCNNSRFKDPIPRILASVVVYKFWCGLCNESYYGECVRHLAVRRGEHIGILL